MGNNPLEKNPIAPSLKINRMQKTRRVIQENLFQFPAFEEYQKHLEIIERHEIINPDICLETCKALIEGISKTIILALDKSQNSQTIDDFNFSRIFKVAIQKLGDTSGEFEIDFAGKMNGLIHALGEIRNKRSDIGHGRAAPKMVFSSPLLSSAFKNITDAMLEYILHHFFSIAPADLEKLEYEDESMMEYNKWLDETQFFPIETVSFSKVLYEHDYDQYENRYTDEYLPSLEENDPDETPSLPETKKEIPFVKEPGLTPPIGQTPKDPLEFFGKTQVQKIKEFAQSNQLDFQEVKSVLEAYVFAHMAFSREKVAEVMLHPPSNLLSRKEILKGMSEKIIAFAKELSGEQQEKQ